MADAAFRVTGVGFSYGNTTVFKGLDLNIPKGKFTALLGANGSGKTTLLHLLDGTEKPASGTITCSGRPVADIPRQELARLVAAAPQEYSFSFPFSVREAVLMGRHPHMPRFASATKADLGIVDQSIEAMNLTSLAGRPVTDLSGGEKQRTVVARTLAQQSDIMLLDEPTSSMDIKHALHTLELLRQLVEDDEKTVIAVLHDLNLAAAFADHMVILRQGDVLEQGAVTEVLTPGTIYDAFGVHCSVEHGETHPQVRLQVKR